MMQYERAAAAKAVEPPPPEKKELPNTGKVVSNNTNTETSLWDKKAWSERDALNYISQQNRGF